MWDLIFGCTPLGWSLFKQEVLKICNTLASTTNYFKYQIKNFIWHLFKSKKSSIVKPKGFFLVLLYIKLSFFQFIRDLCAAAGPSWDFRSWFPFTHHWMAIGSTPAYWTMILLELRAARSCKWVPKLFPDHASLLILGPHALILVSLQIQIFELNHLVKFWRTKWRICTISCLNLLMSF